MQVHLFRIHVEAFVEAADGSKPLDGQQHRRADDPVHGRRSADRRRVVAHRTMQARSQPDERVQPLHELMDARRKGASYPLISASGVDHARAYDGWQPWSGRLHQVSDESRPDSDIAVEDQCHVAHGFGHTTVDRGAEPAVGRASLHAHTIHRGEGRWRRVIDDNDLVDPVLSEQLLREVGRRSGVAEVRNHHRKSGHADMLSTGRRTHGTDRPLHGVALEMGSSRIVAGLSDSIRSALIGLVRRGPRTVLWGTDVAGFANNLYLWLAAATSQRSGHDTFVLRRQGMSPWLAQMPSVDELLTIGAEHVRFVDQRDLGHHQVYGVDFSGADLERFIGDFLLPSPLLRDLPHDDPSRVVVNVRRGDYYSDPIYRGQYSFDVVEYVRTALEVARRQQAVDSVHVVSDDIAWCEDRLGWLSEGYATTFAEPGQPVSHFREVASASRLILANSTFSYWGAYVSNVVHSAEPARVIAPWFHNRMARQGAAWQLDPRWTVIREIRGGWDA